MTRLSRICNRKGIQIGCKSVKLKMLLFMVPLRNTEEILDEIMVSSEHKRNSDMSLQSPSWISNSALRKISV